MEWGISALSDRDARVFQALYNAHSTMFTLGLDVKLSKNMRGENALQVGSLKG